ncbi:MAG: hypothetical protein LBV21_07215, partial [Candidatus Adiutrix sp.]|nr:hypothetical protein [Candidatus Adiutrix sp.]
MLAATSAAIFSCSGVLAAPPARSLKYFSNKSMFVSLKRSAGPGLRVRGSARRVDKRKMFREKDGFSLKAALKLLRLRKRRGVTQKTRAVQTGWVGRFEKRPEIQAGLILMDRDRVK